MKATRKKNRLFGATVLALLAIFSLVIARRSLSAATLQDLDSKITELETAVELETDQGIEILSAFSVVTAPRQSLTVAQVGGQTSVDLPVYYRASTSPVSSLQFDVVLSTGLSVSNVVPGIAAQAAGKGVQGNPVQVGHRVIIFGLNQVAIPSGPVAVLTVSLGGNIGKIPIQLSGISGSSPSGTNVPLTGKAGAISCR